ncbi:MAG: tyrosine-type recombinase/integrase [Burkholderiales bacterium]|nr:tyrosine-type recombinase/integrase [Burkholderiales bacterium]
MRDLLADWLADTASASNKGDDMTKRKLAARINLLSAREVLSARDGELSDGGGLLLRCSGENAAWVLRYTAPSGKRREMGLGTCSRQNAQAAGVSLTHARELAAQARAMLASVPPRDPIDEREKAKAAAKESEARRKAEKQSATATLAREARAYHAKLIEPNRPPKPSADWINSLENHVPAVLWHKPIAEITRAELLDFLRDIQIRMADTAQRIRVRLDVVFDDAMERGIVAANPVALLLTKLRREHKPKRSQSFAALPFPGIGDFVQHLRQQSGIAARCLEFTILTACRTGESIGAKWIEFDLDQALWTIPAKRMKGHEEHRVYLCPRAIEIVNELQGFGPEYVFPSVTDKTKPMSNMAMLAVLKRMKRTDITVHGFRSTFSTWANENAVARADVIEACLAHREGDKIRAAYNRATFANDRRKLLTVWSEYVETGKLSGNVIELNSAKAA